LKKVRYIGKIVKLNFNNVIHKIALKCNKDFTPDMGGQLFRKVVFRVTAFPLK